MGLYDTDVITYSADGRLFQVEYATKPVEKDAVTIAVRCTDGVLILAGKVSHTKLLAANGNRKIFAVDPQIVCAGVGYRPDVLAAVDRARLEANAHYRDFGLPVTVSELTARVALTYHASHAYLSGVGRPYGCCLIFADSSSVYALEPNGQYYGYFGCCFGKDTSLARAELHKVDWSATSMEEAVPIVKRIVASLPQSRDDKFGTEMLRIPRATGKPEWLRE